MTMLAGETFAQFIWRSIKNPLKAFGGSPLAQSAAAFGLNVWCLVLAPLGQLWVFGSAVLLFIQTHNTWAVATGRRGKPLALIIGMILVALNLGALTLAILAQVWVFASLA